MREKRDIREQTPPPSIARRKKNEPMSGGTSRISPAGVERSVGRSGFVASPTGGAGTRDESSRKPSSTSTASAGFSGLRIDHSGARKETTSRPTISSSVPFARRRSSRNSSSVISK